MLSPWQPQLLAFGGGWAGGWAEVQKEWVRKGQTQLCVPPIPDCEGPAQGRVRLE